LSTIAAILTGGRCAALQLPWHHLRFVHTNAVRATLAERYAPATANRYLAALRGVLKACWQLDLIDQQTLAKTLNFKPIPGESEESAAGRSLSYREMITLMQHLAEQGVNGLRDAALIAIAYAAPGGPRCAARRSPTWTSTTTTPPTARCVSCASARSVTPSTLRTRAPRPCWVSG
jgi:hypothetical protein